MGKPFAKMAPSFNTLILFPVGHESMHHVEKIKDNATVPRLAFTGWFTVTRKPGYRKLNIQREQSPSSS